MFLPLPNWVESIQQLDFNLDNQMKMKDHAKMDAASASSAKITPPSISSVELISVVVGFTPTGVLIPGMIVFPGSLMTYR